MTQLWTPGRQFFFLFCKPLSKQFAHSFRPGIYYNDIIISYLKTNYSLNIQLKNLCALNIHNQILMIVIIPMRRSGFRE